MRGSIRNRGDDNWQVRVSLGRDPETNRYRYCTKWVHGTKRDAQNEAAALVTEVLLGRQREPSRHTVTELLDRWLAHAEGQRRAPSTLVRYRSAVEVNIKPRLGNIEIHKLGGAQLDAFYGQLAKAGLSPLSIRKSHTILSAAFNQAMRWGWIDRNPVQQASPPPTRAREIHPPTAKQLRSLLTACEDGHPDLGSLIYVAATTGARRGELCGLRWSDVNLNRATLTVARSISDAGQEVAVKDTKIHQARRIAIDPSTVDVLRRHRRLAEDRAALAGVVVAPSAYVWSQDLDCGSPYRPDRVTGAFRSLRDRLDMPTVTFHALRHFAATTLAAEGVGVRTIAGRLGHADPGITLRIYAPFLDAPDREAATAIGRALDGLHPASAKRRRASSKGRRGTTSRRPGRTEGSSPLATKS